MTTRRELFKQEFFPRPEAAESAKEAHERAGREAEVVSRSRAGIVVHCVKSYVITEVLP